jgi:peptidoglycan/xylan/chitin deacetylase (PgdA/CDA1 family)
MNLQALAALFTLLTAANAFDSHLAQRQAPPAPPPAPPAPTSAKPSSSGASTSGSSSSSGSVAASGTTSATAPPGVTTVPAAAGTGIPPLANITFGMPTQATLPVTATFAAGATPPVSGAPALPSTFVFKQGDWPAQDQIPDTSSSEVQEWMKELDGFNIPNLKPTVDGSCAGDAAAAGDAANRGWWTCGGYTRTTDITACPDKLTWGVSFDDGPSPYTQTLLKYLTEKSLLATFFVVGSRVIERPTILIEEYMTGHEISVHTWSHKHLTALTNEQIVAELGWTRKAIKTVLGVTPTTMRPPYGDIDDRVRAISLAMGMVPIIWTRTPTAGQFDTNDWRVAGGLVNGTDSFASFQAILGNATTIDTGFIVLQHDLFEITVDLATGYTLNAALSHNPPFNLQPIGKCSKIATPNLYLESNTNGSFPYTNHTSGKSKPNDALVNTIPILNTFFGVGLAILCSVLYGFH